MSSVDDPPQIPKVETFEEEDFSDDSNAEDDQNTAQEPAQVQKRKGGRKPVRTTVGLSGTVADAMVDIRDFGGTETEKPTSTSSVPRTAHRIHQATGDYNQAP